MTGSSDFRIPDDPEKSLIKRKHNLSDFDNIISNVLYKSRNSTFAKLKLLGKEREERASQKIYDDDLTRIVSEEFSDRLGVFFIIGDAIRAIRGSVHRYEISSDHFVKIALEKIVSGGHIFREDIAKLTKVDSVIGNSVIPFMNGGPAGENWNNANKGFYDYIDNISKESIIGIELGFKADNYGLEVSRKLIAKKHGNPYMTVNLLIDGFVSILIEKPPSTLSEFEHNTIKMIDDMRKAGINVYVNDSWNPISEDFLAANHIKLWIFDGNVAFFGGIGIESQFRTLLYDEMDSVQGPFVRILTIMALLLMTNQKGHEGHFTKEEQIYQMKKERLEKLFSKDSGQQGNITMRLSMDVPGYVQDAQHNYIELLTHKDVDEIFIMAPYFSDHKVAKALVLAADRLLSKHVPQKDSRFRFAVFTRLKKSRIRDASSDKDPSHLRKRIHVIFPKKPEDRIIAEVSRYYAYYLRNNPIVETLQFYAEVDSQKFEMLHAKQMVVVLRDEEKKWTKYVKCGGSYNPAGRAQNMWEINAVTFNGCWNESDDGPNSKIDNPIKDYLENVMKIVVMKYSQPFPWGMVDAKLSIWDKMGMEIARHLWF